jgi:capsular polysaccharide biosynthesis protein
MKRLIIGIATASSPKLETDKIVQVGAIYSLFGNIVTESLRESGLDGDSITNANPVRLTARKVLKILIRCILTRSIILNSYYLGPWFSNFGHFLLESITRMNASIAVSRYKLLFHTMDSSIAHQKIFQYQEKLLSTIGIDSNRVKILINNPVLIFNSIIVSGNAIFPRELKPPALEIINLIKRSNKTNLDFGDKIYISRQKLSLDRQRIPENLSLDLENIFQKHGFKVIHPQELDIRDQISAISRAKFLAGPQGSALHLSIFCDPGTKIIEIGDEVQTVFPNTQQKIICNLLSQNFCFIPYDAVEKTYDFKKIEDLIKI